MLRNKHMTYAVSLQSNAIAPVMILVEFVPKKNVTTVVVEPSFFYKVFVKPAHR